jgi:hypothetical protein
VALSRPRRFRLFRQLAGGLPWPDKVSLSFTAAPLVLSRWTDPQLDCACERAWQRQLWQQQRRGLPPRRGGLRHQYQ